MPETEFAAQLRAQMAQMESPREFTARLLRQTAAEVERGELKMIAVEAKTEQGMLNVATPIPDGGYAIALIFAPDNGDVEG